MFCKENVPTTGRPATPVATHRYPVTPQTSAKHGQEDFARPLRVQRYLLCEHSMHCGGHRPRVLLSTPLPPEEAERVLLGSASAHPTVYLLPVPVTSNVRSLTFEEARAMHARPNVRQ